MEHMPQEGVKPKDLMILGGWDMACTAITLQAGLDLQAIPLSHLNKALWMNFAFTKTPTGTL